MKTRRAQARTKFRSVAGSRDLARLPLPTDTYARKITRLHARYGQGHFA